MLGSLRGTGNPEEVADRGLRQSADVPFAR